MTLSHDFWMGIYPVTQEQYAAVTGDNPSEFKGQNRPVEKVSWEDAVAFCEKLTEQAAARAVCPTGCVFRLPTEAEWEYCCRAGTETATAFGDGLSSEQANFNGNYPYGDAKKGPYLEQTSDVGSYQPNAWGLYDMHGNVWEWCLDAADLDNVTVKTDTYKEAWSTHCAKWAAAASTAVAPGTATAGSAVRRAATRSIPAIATTSWASVSAWPAVRPGASRDGDRRACAPVRSRRAHRSRSQARRA